MLSGDDTAGEDDDAEADDMEAVLSTAAENVTAGGRQPRRRPPDRLELALLWAAQMSRWWLAGGMTKRTTSVEKGPVPRDVEPASRPRPTS